jgi:hypothetical protein
MEATAVLEPPLTILLDCDMGDGKVQALHQNYITHLAFIQSIGLGSRKNDTLVTQDIKSLLVVLA